MNSAPKLHSGCTFQKMGTMPPTLHGSVFSVHSEAKIIDAKASTFFPRLKQVSGSSQGNTVLMNTSSGFKEGFPGT